MGLWLKVHREVTGAWRSACYDVYRQVSRRQLTRLLTAETTEFAERGRHRLPARVLGRRRIGATAGVALLVAGGAAGTYLGVAGSLTALQQAPAAVVGEPATGAGPAVTDPGAPNVSLSWSAQPTHGGRPQVRRTVPPPVLAGPGIVPPPVRSTTYVPESTPTPSPSPTPVPTPTSDPSPSASSPSPSRTPSKAPKQGQSNARPTGS